MLTTDEIDRMLNGEVIGDSQLIHSSSDHYRRFNHMKRGRWEPSESGKLLSQIAKSKNIIPEIYDAIVQDRKTNVPAMYANVMSLATGFSHVFFDSGNSIVVFVLEGERYAFLFFEKPVDQIEQYLSKYTAETYLEKYGYTKFYIVLNNATFGEFSKKGSLSNVVNYSWIAGVMADATTTYEKLWGLFSNSLVGNEQKIHLSPNSEIWNSQANKRSKFRKSDWPNAFDLARWKSPKLSAKKYGIPHFLMTNPDDYMNILRKLDPVEFEIFVGRFLSFLGYSNVLTTKSTGDMGVDLFASYYNEKYGVQVKRYKDNVGIAAVQQIIGAKIMFEFDNAIVVATADFTTTAQELAQKARVRLIGPSDLWIYSQIIAEENPEFLSTLLTIE